jgi:hypothetical protein
VRAGRRGQPGPGAGRRRPILPLLLVIATLSLGTACTTRGSVTPGPAEAAAAPPAEPFRAQVVGVQWMNPLVRRDYPTEWQLLWVQGLASPTRTTRSRESEKFTRRFCGLHRLRLKTRPF